MLRPGKHTAAEIKHRVYEFLEQGAVGDWKRRLVGRLIVLLIVINLVAVTLESVPEIAARFGVLLSVFVAAGEVEIELPPPRERVRLGVGHFFGEIAVLRRARRSATITA